MTHEGRKKNFDYGAFIGFNLSHSFSALSFIDLYLTEYTHQFQSYVFEKPLDPRYITPDSLFWAHIEGKLPNEVINKYGTEVNYFPNHEIFTQNIRLIHKFLSPKNIWPISADRPNIWIFRFFFKKNFPEICAV